MGKDMNAAITSYRAQMDMTLKEFYSIKEFNLHSLLLSNSISNIYFRKLFPPPKKGSITISRKRLNCSHFQSINRENTLMGTPSVKA